MLKTTSDMVMPTAITGSYPRPLWYDQNLNGRSFKAAMGDSMFREQYLDAVAAVINAQEAAGLDIVTDGDSRFDLAVGGKSWFFYPIERLGGIKGHRSTSRGWMGRHGLRPGHILWEVQEAYQPAIVADKLSRGPLEYAALWQVAQRLTDKPVKFGAICAPGMASMLWDEHYHDDKALVLDLCDILNAELKELATLRAAERGGSPETGSLTEIEDKLKTICDAAMQGKRIGVNDNLFEVGASSLKLIEIHERIDHEYPGLVDLTELFDFPTIGELARHLQSKLGT